MQTFLPYSSFVKSARCLDSRRLNKQIVECEQILRALSDSGYGWQNHPAVRMWQGYEWMLWLYGCSCYNEWQRRYVLGLRGGKYLHKSGERIRKFVCAPGNSPPWLGSEEFHSSHRAALLAKDNWYLQFGWTEKPDINYVWPTRTEEK